MASTLAEVPILDVWRRLGGGELRHGRGRAFWRNGDGLNVAIDRTGARWFDHAAGTGGGVLALVQTALRCDGAAALSWLEQERFIESRTPITEAERRILAQRRSIASDMARDTLAWIRVRRGQLEAEKASLFQTASFPRLRRAIHAARELTRLESGNAAIVARAFFDHRLSNADEAAALVERGRWWDSEDRRIAAQCVSLLVWAGNREGSNAE